MQQLTPLFYCLLVCNIPATGIDSEPTKSLGWLMILVASYQDEYILLPCCFPQERSRAAMLQASNQLQVQPCFRPVISRRTNRVANRQLVGIVHERSSNLGKERGPNHQPVYHLPANHLPATIGRYQPLPWRAKSWPTLVGPACWKLRPINH